MDTTYAAVIPENQDEGEDLIVHRDGNLSQGLTVHLGFGGAANVNDDYYLTRDNVLVDASTLTFAPGENHIALKVVPVNDHITEPDENAIIGVATGVGYLPGNPGAKAFLIVAPAPPTDFTKIVKYEADLAVDHAKQRDLKLTPDTGAKITANTTSIEWVISGGHVKSALYATETKEFAIDPGLQGTPKKDIVVTFATTYSVLNANDRKTKPYKVTYDTTSDYKKLATDAKTLPVTPKLGKIKTFFPDDLDVAGYADLKAALISAFKDAVTKNTAKEDSTFEGTTTATATIPAFVVTGNWKLKKGDNSTVIITRGYPKL